MFYYETPWFNQDSESGNCFFFFICTQLTQWEYWILKVKSSQMKNETPYTSTVFFFLPEHVQYFYFLETKFMSVFKICQLAVNFAIRSIKFTLVIEF